ncbi:hypothetical protein [Sphaerisporangium perillae]|uniref:hypothetical protein n=1 Tax=Sphaerisporangium perillae TaxID=2935860 RepID=UPI00200E4614|nr:hypothetical protein [Sphaerisporangium perillae]
MRKGTTAISAGALTLALSGGTALLVAAPAAGSSSRLADCDRGGTPLSSLTGGVCDLLSEVTDTVGDLGGGLKPVTDTVQKTVETTVETTTEKVLGGGNGAMATRPPSASASPSQAPGEAGGGSGGSGDGSGDDLLGLPIDTGCLPLIGSSECGDTDASPAPKSPAGPDRSGSGDHPATRSAPRMDNDRPPADRPPTGEPPVQGATLPAEPVDRAMPSVHATSPPRADIEMPPLVPLWPGQPLPVLTGTLQARKTAPPRPYDPVGTALTAVLLASAILATRVVQSRRAADTPRSMPFEGLRSSEAGRHRLA